MKKMYCISIGFLVFNLSTTLSMKTTFESALAEQAIDFLATVSIEEEQRNKELQRELVAQYLAKIPHLEQQLLLCEKYFKRLENTKHNTKKLAKQSQ